MTATAWTAQIEDRLRQLHAEGLTFKQIAQQLNAEFDTSLTRNACVGRGYRLRLPSRATFRPGQPQRPLTIYQLTSAVCHWPVAGERPPYSYCGAPAYQETPFCRKHCAQAYVAPHKHWS
jgi:hypothetical protein